MEWLGKKLVVAESIFKDWDRNTWDESCTEESWVRGNGNQLEVASLDVVWPNGEGIASHKACEGILFCTVAWERGLLYLM